jgi:peptide chain release factor 2
MSKDQMEAERQNQIASRLADYAARELALRGYL